MAIPLLVAGGIAAAGAIAGGSAAAAKAGANRRSANFFYDPTGQRGTGHNPNAANWGGDPNGAQTDADRLRWGADHAQGRRAEQVDYTQANQDRYLQLQARHGQGQVARMMMNRASGAVPSIAGQQAAHDAAMLQQQAQRANQQAFAAQASQAASARGAAGLALAQQNAANNTANAQAAINQNTAQSMQGISGQAQVNAANERLQAENAALGAYGAMRGGDAQSQNMTAQQAQMQAQINARQREANDQFSTAFTQQEMGVKQAQLNAKMQEQGILNQSYTASEGANQQTAQANANREAGWVEKMIPSLSDAQAKDAMSMSSLMSGSKQEGPAAGGDPYAEAGQAGKAKTDMGSIMALAGSMSDTRAKKSLLLERGRREGAAMAANGADPNDVAAIRYGSWSQNASPQALDERYRQNEVGPETVGRSGLNSAIEAQIARDQRARPQATRDALTLARGGRAPSERSADQVLQDEGARAQWERSFGSAEAAQDEQRTRDNLAEAKKIREGFEKDQGQSWYMQPAPAGLFDSDARAKEQAEARGFAKGQAEAHQQIADSRMAQAARFGAAGLVSPGHMLAAGVEAARSIKPQARAAEAAAKAGPAEAPAKREPRTPESGRKGLIIERGKETQGLPSKATSVQDMMTRPSELRTPYDTSRHFVAPQETLALLPGRADGGPVAAGKPYLVGERGPEVVVPSKDGVVVPNEEVDYEAPSRMTGLGEDFNYRQFMGDMDSRLAEAQAAKRNEPKSMKRDSKADQKRVGDAYANRLSSEADEYIAAMKASTGRGASVALDEGEVDGLEPERGAVADANRAMRGEPYTYKPEYTPPNERARQPHFGFMAQNLEKSPVSATAVEEGPDGMKRVDRDRMLQVVAAGVAELQRQQDETRLALRRGGRR